MAGKKGRSGRPKEVGSRDFAVMVRLTKEERDGLAVLVKRRAAALSAEAIRVRGPDVIRWLMARELAVVPS